MRQTATLSVHLTHPRPGAIRLPAVRLELADPPAALDEHPHWADVVGAEVDVSHCGGRTSWHRHKDLIRRADGSQMVQPFGGHGQHISGKVPVVSPLPHHGSEQEPWDAPWVPPKDPQAQRNRESSMH
jgi:hypothetical protein